jgi:antitoxin HicB
MKYVYPVVFEKDEDKIGVSVPDVPGCNTFGNDMADAIEMAADAIAMMLASYEDDGTAIPAASDISAIKTDGTLSLVVADTDVWRRQFDNKAVKKTLSIPAWLNKKAETAGVNFSQVLQDGLNKIVGAA